MQLQDVNEARLSQLRAQMNGLRDDVATLRGLLADDPLVGLARGLSATHDNVVQAEALVAAAADLVQAGGTGLDLGDRFVALRSGGTDLAGKSVLAGMVGLMATSAPQIDGIGALMASARQSLSAIPAGANGEIRRVADLMAAPLATYGPLLEQYRAVDQILPSILGWGGSRRYLVLAEDPAELRPSGGYAGTIGVVGFKDGQLVEQSFQDVYALDLKPGVPFVQPPEGLQSHLLVGGASWQLADANWSPDFPTAAQDALRLYTLESGDTRIDGVIALTTYAVDKILEVVGPVEVPEYGVTVRPGEVTLTALGLTRGISTPTSQRKEFLNVLANTVLGRLLALPPSKWLPLFQAFQAVGNERLMLTWFADPAAEKLVAGSPMAGAVRQDAGDYLSVVEANVAPTSKYNLVVKRHDSLDVAIAADGSAEETLRLDWTNDAAKAGEPYASIRDYSTAKDGRYGAYVRVLTPIDSELVDASGQTDQPIAGVESIAPEAGRNSFANYLLMAPGASSLTYRWLEPEAVRQAAGAWTYVLTVQRQPGAAPGTTTIRVTLPAGARVGALPAGATLNGSVVSFTTAPSIDAQLTLQYTLP
jgi:hypothetical protein